MNLYDALLQIGAPQFGNNADARAAQMVVDGDAPLTTQQLQETFSVFWRHMQRLRTSLIGFYVSHWTLTDSSKVRIMSNSGLHTVFVKPAPVPAKQAASAWGVFCIPADTTHQYGWIPPAVSGSNGTPGTSASNDHAGTVLDLKRKNGLWKGDRLHRFQPSSPNNAFFTAGSASNMSAQSEQFREWFTADRKSLVTTSTNTIRINGEDFGAPPGIGPHLLLWACIYQYDAGGGVGPKPYLFAVCASTYFVQAYRSPLKENTWTAVASLDVRTLDTNVTLDAASNSILPWIRKIACNASQTVTTVWLQSPLLDNGTDTQGWVGMIDVNMATGAVTTTKATGEWTRKYGDGQTYEHNQVGGVRQITFDYDSDTKVLTELHFSGEQYTQQVNTTSSTGDSVNGSTDSAIDVTRTDTRQVTLVWGTFSQVIASGVVGTYSWHSHTHHDYTSTSSGYSGDDAISTDQTTNVAYLLHYGGAPGLFLLKTSANRTVSNISGSGSITNPDSTTLNAGYPEDNTNGSGSHLALSVILSASQQLDAGSADHPAYSQTDHSVSGSYTAPRRVSLTNGDSNPTMQTAWGSSGLVITTNGHPAYTVADDTNWANYRALDDFMLLSIPRLGSDGNPDPGAFLSYCSDTNALAKYNVDASLGVLKEIKFQ